MIEPRLLKLVSGFFSFIFGIALAFLVGYIIYLGIIYIIKAEEGAKKIQGSIIYILLAIVLIFLSRLIPKLIEMFFK